MFICVIRIYQQHIRRIMMHVFLRKCLQAIWLQSTFNNTNRSPSQCRELLCLGLRITMIPCQVHALADAVGGGQPIPDKVRSSWS